MSAAHQPTGDELRRIAVDVATDAAGFVGAALSARLGARHLGTEAKTSPTDLVTEVDRATEARIVAALQAARPHDGIQGEEGAGFASRTGLRWVVDPIDGTTNFVYGFPAVAVSVAVVSDSDPLESLAGAVADVSSGEVFSAALGGGAFLDGRQLGLDPERTVALGHALIATGFAYESDQRAVQAERLLRVLPAVRDIRRAGSAALDMCSVAAGRVDGYFETGVQLWDRAAGLLVAAEAGASSGVSGELTWAAHPSLSPALLELLG